jgi:hypothetical protein
MYINMHKQYAKHMVPHTSDLSNATCQIQTTEQDNYWHTTQGE